MSDKDKLITTIADTLRKQLSIDAPPQRVTRSTSFRKTRSRPTPTTTGAMKVLISIVKNGERIFYIAGDRAKPDEIFKAPFYPATNLQPLGYLQSTGGRENDWLFWCIYRPQLDRDVAKIEVKSPSIKKHNWTYELKYPLDVHYRDQIGGTGYLGGGFFTINTINTPVYLSDSSGILDFDYRAKLYEAWGITATTTSPVLTYNQQVGRYVGTYNEVQLSIYFDEETQQPIREERLLSKTLNIDGSFFLSGSLRVSPYDVIEVNGFVYPLALYASSSGKDCYYQMNLQLNTRGGQLQTYYRVLNGETQKLNYEYNTTTVTGSEPYFPSLINSFSSKFIDVKGNKFFSHKAAAYLPPAPKEAFISTISQKEVDIYTLENGSFSKPITKKVRLFDNLFQSDPTLVIHSISYVP